MVTKDCMHNQDGCLMPAEAQSCDNMPAAAVVYNSEMGRPRQRHFQQAECAQASVDDSATQPLRIAEEEQAGPCSKKPKKMGHEVGQRQAALKMPEGRNNGKKGMDKELFESMAAIPAPPPRTQVPVLRPTAIPAAAATTTLKRPRGDPIARIRDECVTNRAGNRRSADAAPDGVLLGSSGAQAWHVPHSTTPPPRPPCSPAPTDQTDQTESTDHTHIRGVHEELHVQECTSNAVDYRRAQAGSLLTNCHDSSASRHRPSNLARAQGDNRVDGVTVSEAGSRGPHGNASCVVEGGGEGGEGEGLWWGPQPRPPSTASETTPRPAWALAQGLSCLECGDLLKEAVTCVDCLHSFCYDCIAPHAIVGGKHNRCPVQGCETVLGPDPWDHGKLRYDTALDGLVSRVFPRPRLDAALAARRAEREQGTREVRAALAAAPRGVASMG